MKTSAILIGALACAVFVAGCKGGISEKDLVGTWTGKMTMSAEDKQKAIDEAKKQNPQSAAAPPEMFESMLSNIEMPLTLREDKTFTMTMVMFPMEGTWSLTGQTVKLKVTKMMGMDVNEVAKQSGRPAENQDLDLTVSADGKTMTGASKDSSGGGSFTFTRSDAK
jgi:hypothetical protein